MSSGHGGGHGGSLELPGLHEIHEWIEGAGGGGFFLPGWLIIVLFFLVAGFYNMMAPAQSASNWGMVLLLGSVWMPILFGRFAMMRFIQMRRLAFVTSQDHVLLELRIPRDTAKSPKAMETFFSSLHLGPGEGNWVRKFFGGSVRPWFSFEIVSRGGEVRFYVYTRTSFRRAIESYLYSQYPEVELIEAVDYSRLVDAHHPPYKMYACEYKKKNPSPRPIRTYVDAGLDKPGLKVEEQIDPLAQVLELFGSIGPGEEIWTQIVVRLSKSEIYRSRKKGFRWHDEAGEIVESIRGKVTNEHGQMNMTEVQKEEIAGIERNVSKQAFDVGIRSIYLAPESKWKGMGGFVANMWKPFTSERQNAIEPAPWFGSEKFNEYPWEDLGGFRFKAEMHEAMEVYRLRSFFAPPFRSQWMIMSTEELASIFHVPSSAAKVPTLPRIQSSTGAAPANLPQ
jgi:hypothetical protein